MSLSRVLTLCASLCALAAAGRAQTRGPDFEWNKQGTAGVRVLRVDPERIGLPRAAFTVEAIVRVRPGGGDAILTFEDSRGQAPLRLDFQADALRCAFTTDFRPEPLGLTMPLGRLDGARPDRVLLRYTSHRVDLFVDGVLADEEWPMGVLAPSGVTAVRVGPWLDSVRVWRRALTDAEIAEMNGGTAEVARRADALFGAERSGSFQYWRPRGHDTSAGDAMPFFHQGTFHVFFLLDRRHHRSKWGLGAHQWGHVSSNDLVHWTRHPAALTIDNPAEASICTGSVFFHGGRFYAFYATRQPDRSERLGMAVSHDGIVFEKVLPTPFAEPAPPWKRGPNRDPFVFEESGRFTMLATAELEDPPAAGRGGALEQLVSTDLRNWTPLAAPFYTPGYPGHQPECSDRFFWRGWYYLLFGQDGATRYRMAKSPAGPWLKPDADMLDGPQARVMKTAAFTGGRRIAAGFVPDGGWGGDLLFRELTQFPDGTLGTKFPSEMVPPAGAPAKWRAQALTANASVAGASVRVVAVDGFGAAAVDGVPKNFRLRATLVPSRGAGAFGLLLRGRGKAEGGLKLDFEPARRRVSWLPGNAGSLASNPQGAIESVEGLDRPLQVDVIVRSDIFDASLSGGRTVVFRGAGAEGDRLFVYAHNGALEVHDLEIRPLE